MRNIVNISLPEQMVKAVEDGVKKEHFSSKSEFFHTLLRSWMEEKLVKELEESCKEFRNSGGKLLKSLKDLR